MTDGGPLFIDGGGDTDDTWPVFARFLDAVDGGPVGVLPAASPREQWDAAHEAAAERLGAHGHDSIEAWTDLDPLGLDDLREMAGILIAAGDPGRLLARLTRADVAGLLAPYVGGGGPLYVAGEAAPVAGRGLDEEEDPAGLDLCAGWDLRVDYDGDQSAQVDAAAETGRPRLAIPPRSGIRVSGKTVTVVGYEPVLAVEARSGNVERLVMDDELALEG